MYPPLLAIATFTFSQSEPLLFRMVKETDMLLPIFPFAIPLEITVSLLVVSIIPA